MFPEFALTGYTCQDLFLQDTLLDGATEALKQLAVDTARYKSCGRSGAATGDAGTAL